MEADPGEGYVRKRSNLDVPYISVSQSRPEEGVLRDLPVSTELAIRRDIRGVEEFFSLISGEEVRMENGFVDLTILAILAGYKFQSKNMTVKGVQVQGTLLNKCVYTGDDCWQCFGSISF